MKHQTLPEAVCWVWNALFLSCLQFHLSAVQFEFTIPRKEPGNLGGQIPINTYERCLLNEWCGCLRHCFMQALQEKGQSLTGRGGVIHCNPIILLRHTEVGTHLESGQGEAEMEVTGRDGYPSNWGRGISASTSQPWRRQRRQFPESRKSNSCLSECMNQEARKPPR